MLLPRRTLLKRHQEFNSLSEEQKIEVRLGWLEWKTVQLLWALTTLQSALIAAVAGWITHSMVGYEPWIVLPVGLVTFLVAGWWGTRHAFKGAPPHIDFIDP